MKAEIQFSIEADEDWPSLQSEMARILQDARDSEEAASFVTGNGSPPAPGGIVGSMDATSQVGTSGNGFGLDDIGTKTPRRRRAVGAGAGDARDPHPWRSEARSVAARRRPAQVEICSLLDDHSRHLLGYTAFRRVDGDDVVAKLWAAGEVHGWPAATLTDNGAICTSRFTGGHIAFEHLLKQ